MNWRICISIAACLLGSCLSTEVLSAQGSGSPCALYQSEDKTLGAPVVLGAMVVVPEIHLRFVQAVPKVVNLHYYWRWMERPGVWVDADEWVKCTVVASSELTAPSRTIEPRGWRSGAKPKFSHLEVAMELDGCAPLLIVEPKYLKRYQGTIAIVKLACGGPAEVRFEKPKP